MSQRKIKKILAIDDDRSSLDLLEQTLSSIGFDVTVETNPDKGIKKAEEIVPDLVFLGLLLTGSNGLKVSKSIHAIKDLEKLPVIMMTTYAGELDARYTVSIGIPDVIVKPLKPEEIISKTSALLGKDTGPSAIKIVAKEPPLKKWAETFPAAPSIAEPEPGEPELVAEETESFGEYDDEIIELEEAQDLSELPEDLSGDAESFSREQPDREKDLYSDKDLDMEWEALNMADEPSGNELADNYADITDEDVHEVLEDDELTTIPEEEAEIPAFDNKFSDKAGEADYPEFSAADLRDEAEEDDQTGTLSEEDTASSGFPQNDHDEEDRDEYRESADSGPHKVSDEDDEELAGMLAEDRGQEKVVDTAFADEYIEDDLAAYQEKKSPIKKMAVISAAVIITAGLVFGALQAKKLFFEDKSIETYLKGPSEQQPPVQKETVTENVPAGNTKTAGTVPSIPVEEAKTPPPAPVKQTGPPAAKEPASPKPQEPGKALYSVQIGVFQNENNAAALTSEMKKKGYDAFIQKDAKDPGRILHRVLVGRFDDRKKAAAESGAILQKEGIKSVIYHN